MSIPASFIVSMALGFTPWVSTPALKTLVPVGAKCRNQPSAICERQELPVHRMSKFIGWDLDD
jgi:hypothetical protein